MARQAKSAPKKAKTKEASKPKPPMVAEELFWADRAAADVLAKEGTLKRGLKVFRTEMGIGASGIPHIGSLGDVIRNYAVALALKDKGVQAELIAYSDDRDGLRKVPQGFPNSLEKEIGKPVTEIADPFGCHPSYGAHVSGLLLDAVESLGVKDYRFQSGADAYGKGLLNQQVEKLLLNEAKVKRIVKEEVGQELPGVWFPVCERCGRVYTTRVTKVIPAQHAVEYACDLEFKGKNVNTGKEVLVKGCGLHDSISYWNGHGKLAWKCEFAARWAAQQISFEAYGKDIADSVRVNDRICREILGWEPPLHMVYEMFLEKGGKKISKSLGGVFTPQDWMRFGSPQSLRLLMLKRFSGTRELSPSDIPVYMDEVDKLEKTYRDEETIENEKELTHLKRLFEYVHFLKLPALPTLKVPYSTLVNMIQVFPVEPEKRFQIISESLANMGLAPKNLGKQQDEELRKRIEYAANWIEAEGLQAKPASVKVVTKEEKKALQDVVKMLNTKIDGGEMQAKLFEIARANSLETRKLFGLIYQILLGSERGPRAGQLMEAIGKDQVAKMIERVLKN
jgi:lysyl-tRNA synthetase class 1